MKKHIDIILEALSAYYQEQRDNPYLSEEERISTLNEIEKAQSFVKAITLTEESKEKT